MLTLRYGFCIILVLMVTGCSWLKPNPEKPNDHHPVSECRNKPKNPWKEVKNLFCKALGTCQEVKLLVSHPAEVDLSKYKTVAFAKIDGDYGNSFATAPKERKVQNGNLTVMDRTQLDKVLTELQMTQEDLFDAKKRKQLGLLLPAAVLFEGIRRCARDSSDCLFEFFLDANKVAWHINGPFRTEACDRDW